MSGASTFESLVQITHRFFWCLDEFRYQDILSMMLPDAVWHRQGRALQGHAQILAALNERSNTQRIRHVITNPFVAEESGDSARLIAYMIGYKCDEGVKQAAPQTIDNALRFLLVETHFKRGEGRWLIAQQRGTPEFEFRQPS